VDQTIATGSASWPINCGRLLIALIKRKCCCVMSWRLARMSLALFYCESSRLHVGSSMAVCSPQLYSSTALCSSLDHLSTGLQPSCTKLKRSIWHCMWEACCSPALLLYNSLSGPWIACPLVHGPDLRSSLQSTSMSHLLLPLVGSDSFTSKSAPPPCQHLPPALSKLPDPQPPQAVRDDFQKDHGTEHQARHFLL
jgi:hypothetical protein